MKPEHPADAEGSSAGRASPSPGANGHDSGSAAAALVDWDGPASSHILSVPCPALLCPPPALRQGIPPGEVTSSGCPLSPATPASSAALVLIPCLGNGSQGWGAERDPLSREPQPGHDGAYPNQQDFPLFPLALSPAVLPTAHPQPFFPLLSRHAFSLCPCRGQCQGRCQPSLRARS